MFAKKLRGIVLAVLMLCPLLLAIKIQPVKATGIIFIRSSGAIDPRSAPIFTADNITYSLTGNIHDNSIYVQRSNIVLDGKGYTVEGTGSGNGVDVAYCGNLTIKT